MTIIGITGGSGAGKTTALSVLQHKGALVIDCDAVYHDLLESGESMKNAIGKRFPGVVVDGVLDRKALGWIVFNDTSALAALNDITHSIIMSEVLRMIGEWSAQGGELVVIDAIALLESGLSDVCDILVGIISPMELRIKRVVERDEINSEYAKMRIEAQPPDEFFIERCDHVLVNDCEVKSNFEIKCNAFFDELLGGESYAG